MMLFAGGFLLGVVIGGAIATGFWIAAASQLSPWRR